MPVGVLLEWRRRLVLQAKPAFGCCGARVARRANPCAKRKKSRLLFKKVAPIEVMSIYSRAINPVTTSPPPMHAAPSLAGCPGRGWWSNGKRTRVDGAGLNFIQCGHNSIRCGVACMATAPPLHPPLGGDSRGEPVPSSAGVSPQTPLCPPVMTRQPSGLFAGATSRTSKNCRS